jgi:hypothetical protein
MSCPVPIIHESPEPGLMRGASRGGRVLHIALGPGELMTMSRPIKLKGFRINKVGCVERNPKRLDVSARLRQRSSKRVKVAKRGQLR